MSRPRAGAIRKIGLMLVCLLVAAAATAYAVTRIRPGMGEGAGWREVEWRMPLDNWGTGLVWRGNGPGGAEILLFARTKTGFCNCFDGIADDNEIDRIGDDEATIGIAQPVAAAASVPRYRGKVCRTCEGVWPAGRALPGKPPWPSTACVIDSQEDIEIAGKPMRVKVARA